MKRILIIDDDEQLLKMLGQMLDRNGYEVVKASNGNVGLKLYRENPADIIITDIVMPEKEGIGTIMELRRDFPNVKIIAISGGGRIGPDQYLPLAKGLGAKYTFEKPIGREELLNAIRKLLHNETEKSPCVENPSPLKTNPPKLMAS